MADQFVRLPDDAGNAGKRMQTFENTVNAQVVQSAAQTPCNSAGVPLDGSTAALSQKFAPAQAAASTGTFTASAQSVTLSAAASSQAFLIQADGTYSGLNFGFFASNDGTNFHVVQAQRVDNGAVEAATGVLTANQFRLWLVRIAGATHIRVTSSAFTAGTANIRIIPVAAPASELPSTPTKGGQRDLNATVRAIKTTPGRLKAVYIVNNQAATTFIQIWDTATGSVVVGTTDPVLEFQVAANADKQFNLPEGGFPFATAISIAATTAEKGNTGSANGVIAFWLSD